MSDGEMIPVFVTALVFLVWFVLFDWSEGSPLARSGAGLLGRAVDAIGAAFARRRARRDFSRARARRRSP